MTGKTTSRALRRSAVTSALLVTSALGFQALAQGTAGEEEITVTAQRRSEAIQKVPIAVSAFSNDQLSKSKLDGGPDLVKAVPNVNFSKGNFTGSNFSIRGIGSKLEAASGDAATGVHINNAPLVASNLFETEFYDVERVEILRGPQGTLYGRNATGGVVNTLTNKPKTGIFEGNIRGEYGNYNTMKARGMVNVPLGDDLALRVAGFYLQRDGFGDNIVTGNDVDDRKLYGVRTTLLWEAADDFTAYVMWDHFNEDDTRSRIGKQFCSKDVGPANIGGLGFSADPAVALAQRGFFSQGCRPTSLYAADALGTVNSQATLGGLFGFLGGFQTGDAYAGKMQDPDVRNIESLFDPIYQTTTDIFLFNADYDISDTLRISFLTTYSELELYTRQDYNRYTPSVAFNATPNPVNLVTTPTAFGGLGVDPALYAGLYGLLFPGGVIQDGQNGNFNRFATSDISSAYTNQFTAEIRFQSSFDGPFNFSAGANFLNFDATGDYYVMFNTGTGWYRTTANLGAAGAGLPVPFTCPPGSANCVYIDNNKDPDRSGHNYYDAYSPYHLESRAVFGEVYYEITDSFKLTGGLRFTSDQKEVENYAVTLGTNGSGIGALIPLSVKFEELTGRIGFDWQADLDFTDSTLIYGFYSRGYKSGGLNSPCSAGLTDDCPLYFDPEFIDSYEIGIKNTLAGGSVQLNLSLFQYKYDGYQVSKIVSRRSTNENIDAEIRGIEFESAWSPFEGFRLNANIGYLDTEITGGTSIDAFNRTQGDPNLVLVKSSAASNCVVPLAVAQAALGISNAINTPVSLLGLCANPLAFDGVAVSLDGNELPNAPEMTLSLGAQYTFNVAEDWELTVRGDYYYQTKTFSRIYNTEADRIKSWDNINLTLTLANESSGWQIDGYVKNLTDETAITDSYLTDDSSGLFRNAFFTDPRTFGIGITYRFGGEEAEVIAEPPPPPPPPVAAKTFIVFFNFDRSDLTPEAQAVIAEAAAAYKSTGSVSIAVVGHTDTVGSAAYNLPLSQRRAASVKDGLIANGVGADAISTDGRGFSEPLVPTGPGVKEPQNRRATIDLTGSGT